MEIEVGQIEVDMEWRPWKARFVAAMENKRGSDGIPLARVIRDNKSAGWTVAQATSDLERLIYQAALNGDAYNRDNATVWGELQKYTMEHPFYAWIRSYDDTKDGRGGWLALLAFCKGPSQNNNRLQLAVRVVGGTNKGGILYSS